MLSDKIELLQTDITKMDVGAIVNAAKHSLLGGGGVDGAIHAAAGSELKEECKLLNGCKTGEAKITGGHNLRAKHIIHTVGPVCERDELEEKYSKLLYNAYYNSLAVAVDNGVRTIAFPNISTGIYSFPKDKAAKIAIKAVNDFMLQCIYPFDKIYFVCFDDENYEIYSKKLTTFRNEEKKKKRKILFISVAITIICLALAIVLAIYK